MALWHSNLGSKRDTRRESRFPIEGSLRILWQDRAGRERISDAKFMNVSASGLKVSVAERIEPRTFVLCNDLKTGVSGRGSVRYCNFAKGRFEIGLEFSGGSGWRGPVESA